MIAIAAINGFVAIVVAYLAYRQEVTRRELKRFNGSVDYQLQAIHQNLIDNPGPPSGPPNEGLRVLPSAPNVRSLADPPESA